MSTPIHYPGRRPVKQQRIMEMVRGGVQSGKLKPGDRLPTRLAMETQFGCSSVTVQRAVDHLIDEGTVVVRGRLGTYVADRPPGLCEYAIVFALERGSAEWVRFWSILEERAQALSKRQPLRFRFFAGIDGRATIAPYRELVAAIEARRLAGIIFTSSPKKLVGTPIVEMPGLPRVAITGHCDLQTVGTLRMDVLSFYDRALNHLQEAGCERIGMLIPPGHDPLVPLLMENAARRELAIHPAWMQLQAQATAGWAAHQVELMLDRPPDDRPDGLIVGDDNLVDAAVDGVHSAGLSMPGEMKLVTHCNFPSPPDGLEVTRLGYDADEVLEACLGMLEAMRQGGEPGERVVRANFGEASRMPRRKPRES